MARLAQKKIKTNNRPKIGLIVLVERREKWQDGHKQI
jgi:hypothetical protein